MDQPMGFVKQGKEKHVCQLKTIWSKTITKMLVQTL